MKKPILSLLLLLTPVLASALSQDKLNNLNLPPGFQIAIYAEVPNARQMALGDTGHIYVGTRRLGKVFQVIDHNGDYKADKVVEIASGLKLPSGVTYHNGDLYVGAVSTIFRYKNIDHELTKPDIIIDTLPKITHHGWKFLDFGPDNLLYFAVGAPCNVCLSKNPVFASILRMDVDKNHAPEIIAQGVRNTVGFDWHPVTHELWFTDNNRDNLSDERPYGELNRVRQKGDHFGFPFFHDNSLPDPDFGTKGKEASAYIEPELILDPHVAALGMVFYTGNMFPSKYKNQIFMAEHGSWNRTPEAGHTGYRITMGREVNGSLQYETFIDGWLGKNNKAFGRPVHLLQLPDGSLLLSDDKAGIIYRITYQSGVF
ncbi:MAG: PQQ-dependent sugar dehydrogenase [Pseudomonadales bacterium]|nr:PQQ-dependent sugar dehydrogenase [Pseudomonadales bacterium]